MKEQFEEHTMFTGRTFPLATPGSSLNKAIGEIQEVHEALFYNSPVDVLAEEYADVLLCLFDSMYRAGVPLQKLQDAMTQKIEINKARRWKDNGDGTYSHIKTTS